MRGGHGGSLCCEAISFRATRKVSIPFKEEGGCPARDYIRRTERVVKVAFPDSSRIRSMGNGRWRSTLKPVTFFSVSATPICEIRVFYDSASRALRLESNKLLLEFLGLPAGMQQQDVDFEFSLAGDLRVSSNPRKMSSFYGSVSMELDSELSLPLSLMPEALLRPVGDTILDRILAAMEGALISGLTTDYEDWCALLLMQGDDLVSQAMLRR